MNDDTGCPPEIRKYILDHMTKLNDEIVSRPLALIAAFISTMHILVRSGLHALGKGQYRNLPDYLHKEMVPIALHATEELSLLPVGKYRVRGCCRSQPKTGDILLQIEKYRVRGH